MPIRVVLHADDLGMSQAVTDGVLQGFRHGLLTSASLLSNAPDAARALDQWKQLEAERRAGELPSLAKRRRLGDPDEPFDLGVHLNLTQGRPLTAGRYPHELLDAAGWFLGVFALFMRLRRGGDRFREGVQRELEQQVQFICDHGQKPTHLSGHQYVELMPAVSEIVPALLDKFGIQSVRVAWEPFLLRSTVLCRFQPWRWPVGWLKRRFALRFRARMDALGVAHPDLFFGTVHAGQIDMNLMRCFLAKRLSRYSPRPSTGEGQGVRAAGIGTGSSNPHTPNASLIEIALHPAETPRDCSAEETADGWRDPLALQRPNELRLLVSDDLAAWMEAQGFCLGRLSVNRHARGA